jgi:hypothetical protein
VPATLKILFLAALVLLAFFPRVLDLDAFRSPDEDRWIANTNGFTTKLAHGQMAALLQQPHPGITTQWFGALTIQYDNWAIKKMPLAVGQALLILLVGYIFGRLWGRAAGVATIASLAANPLVYAHTRIYAMDSLLALSACLALGCLLLWRQERAEPQGWRYLGASAFFTAAAILSKLPGVALLPVIAGVFIYWAWQDTKLTITRSQLLDIGIWIITFVISLALILPSIAIAPANILGDFVEFFRSDDYRELHHLGPYYYLGTLLFFSAPVHFLALTALGWLWIQKRIDRYQREQIAILLAFAVLLVLQMTWGAKKGDRYILPSFVILDVLAGYIIAKLFYLTVGGAAGRLGPNGIPRDPTRLLVGEAELSKGREGTRRDRTHGAILFLLLAALAWQFIIIWQTHPHTLAYVNPLTRQWFGDRRHGWGEGLDIAARYLNTKPNADQLKVATYYPIEFDPYFVGEAVPAHQHEEDSVDYVIIYRAMFERGEDAWETDVINAYRDRQPEKTISLSGIPMVWIYAKNGE